jgi:hypothetical protein
LAIANKFRREAAGIPEPVKKEETIEEQIFPNEEEEEYETDLESGEVSRKVWKTSI